MQVWDGERARGSHLAAAHRAPPRSPSPDGGTPSPGLETAPSPVGPRDRPVPAHHGATRTRCCPWSWETRVVSGPRRGARVGTRATAAPWRLAGHGAASARSRFRAQSRPVSAGEATRAVGPQLPRVGPRCRATTASHLQPSSGPRGGRASTARCGRGTDRAAPPARPPDAAVHPPARPGGPVGRPRQLDRACARSNGAFRPAPRASRLGGRGGQHAESFDGRIERRSFEAGDLRQAAVTSARPGPSPGHERAGDGARPLGRASARMPARGSAAWEEGRSKATRPGAPVALGADGAPFPRAWTSPSGCGLASARR
jgi:hypothetical protein